jgi:probable rRNA maturation factor
MILQWQNRQNKYKITSIKRLIHAAIEVVLAQEKIGLFLEKEGIHAVFSIVLTDNSGIRELNKQYRGINRETDVLSFPLLDNHNRIVTRVSKNQLLVQKNGKRELCFGDIVLSLEKANTQSMEYQHSADREITFLTVHSVLHLLGYDHQNENDEKKMIRKQKKIMQQIIFDSNSKVRLNGLASDAMQGGS